MVKLFLIKTVGTGVKKEIHSKGLDFRFSNRFTKSKIMCVWTPQLSVLALAILVTYMLFIKLLLRNI